MENKEKILAIIVSLLVTFITINGSICMVTRNHSLYGEISVNVFGGLWLLILNAFIFLGIYQIVTRIIDSI
jgi:hypothetical protein